MTTRQKMAEMTKNCCNQIDIDALVVRVGGLGQLRTTEFSTVSASEFMYEWEAAKMAVKSKSRSG